MIQAIIYSAATGRVRRVVDPRSDALTVQDHIGRGEAHLIYTKLGAGQDTRDAWQAAVNAHTGLSPDVTRDDWYVYVDAEGAIQSCGTGDPLCGDGYAGLTMVKAPWGAAPSRKPA
jgi:hypothetical protein